MMIYSWAAAPESLKAYIDKLGWTISSEGTVVNIPPNPDNQIEAIVVQESIKLPRELVVLLLLNQFSSFSKELSKVISQAAKP